MRPHKFRAWLFGEMKYFSLSELYWVNESRGDSSYPDWADVTQSTGLTDKNWKEIYFWDFCLANNNLIVEVEEDSFWVTCFTKDWKCTDIMDLVANDSVSCSGKISILEVIGNKFENPEIKKPL